MRSHTIYRKSTGEILQSGFGIPREGDDLGYVDGQYDSASFYIDAAGDPQPMPPAPELGFRWDRDAKMWFDPRSEEDIRAELNSLRMATSISKSEFLQACMATGLLSPAEAATASRGDIPEAFRSAISTMSSEQQDMVAVIWPAVTRIDRMDPLILAVAKAQGITDQQLDQIFGI